MECLSRAHGFRQELSLAHLFEQFSKLGTAAGVAHFPLFENRGGDFLIADNSDFVMAGASAISR
ncbi:hypothetical protein I633_10340 [Alteromonas mediterranea 615]|uniref:Uncharacterized protein n=1 Tax=Alteromonas mediterranea 615 TaxID=1300253 RepID=S5AF66_9ALTE|nr:hypothetical protein I633_10340 [Alteromonas mediterranea 615]